jgi:hypothetical protein
MPPALVAVIVTWYVPPVPPAGVPDNAPVAVLKLTPFGRRPEIESVGAGDPVAVTWKLKLRPTVAIVEIALVKTGLVYTAKCSEFADVEELMFESPEYDAVTA